LLQLTDLIGGCFAAALCRDVAAGGRPTQHRRVPCHWRILVWKYCWRREFVVSW